MKLIYKAVSLPDGRIVNYHRIYNVNVDLANSVLHAEVGSWEYKDHASRQGIRPDATTLLDLPATPDIPTAINNSFTVLANTTQFKDAEIIDTEPIV